MTHGSLFSGIGGFDLAAEWMGWENIFHCEWNEFGQKVLKYYWPDATSYTDITKTDFSIHRGTIDILTGGFPCQPYSIAGKRKGKKDERHLWPEMLRAIEELQPTYVVGENVFGLINWNGGLVFDEVQTDLETAGYEVFPYVLPTCGINAPHKRERVWFVAYSCSNGYKRREFGEDRSAKDTGKGESNKRERVWNDINGVGKQGIITDTVGKGLQGNEQKILYGSGRPKQRRAIAELYKAQDWTIWPTEWPICAGNDGLSSKLDGITFSKWRNESIKGAGNAIVPQVVYQIFKAIEQYETLL